MDLYQQNSQQQQQQQQQHSPAGRWPNTKLVFQPDGAAEYMDTVATQLRQDVKEGEMTVQEAAEELCAIVTTLVRGRGRLGHYRTQIVNQTLNGRCCISG